MGTTFSGLVSGLDSRTLIDQLVAIERQGATSLSSKQTDLNAQKSIIGSLSTAVASLATAARGLDIDSELRPRSGTFSDARLTAAVSPTATAGVHDIRVKQLAVTKVTQSKEFWTKTAGTLGVGSVDITVSGTTKNVAWTGTDSLDAIATKINDANAGVSAAVLYDGAKYRMMVTAKDTGTAAAPTFVDNGDGLDLSNLANIKVPPKDAIVSINSIDITRPKNVIADALTGVTLTLASEHAVADVNGKLTIGLDQKALTEKVKGVVTAWNSINSALHVQLDYTGTKKGSNTLFGDSMLRQLQSSMGALATKQFGTAPNTTNLSIIGITRDKSGAMTLDETKLAAAIASNPDAASDIFVKHGFATDIASLADQYTKSGTGLFAGKATSLTTRHKSLQTQIERINRNADALQVRLEGQFGALEQAMSQLQSQSNFLQTMIR